LYQVVLAQGEEGPASLRCGKAIHQYDWWESWARLSQAEYQAGCISL